MKVSGKLALSASAIGVASALIAVCTPVSVQAAGNNLVEEVIPSRTFADNITLTIAAQAKAMGPGTGVLGVSSITLTNFDSAAQQVSIFAPVFSGGSNCTGDIVGGGNPQLQVLVQPRFTLHLPYPTALVINPIDGRTCVAGEVTTTLNGGSVRLNVNGVVN